MQRATCTDCGVTPDRIELSRRAAAGSSASPARSTACGLLPGASMHSQLARASASAAAPFTSTAYGASTPFRDLSPDTTHAFYSEQVLPGILRGTLELLRGELAAISFHEARGNRHRVVGVATADRRWSEWRSLACRVPSEFAPRRCTVRSSVMMLPDDDPLHPFAILLARNHNTTLYVTLFDARETIETLHIVRPSALQFLPRDRRLARTVADRAGVALLSMRLR